MNDGTDVGLLYVPPGAVDTLSDAAAGIDSDAGDSADSAVVDGGVSADASVEPSM